MVTWNILIKLHSAQRDGLRGFEVCKTKTGQTFTKARKGRKGWFQPSSTFNHFDLRSRMVGREIHPGDLIYIDTKEWWSGKCISGCKHGNLGYLADKFQGCISYLKCWKITRGMVENINLDLLLQRFEQVPCDKTFGKIVLCINHCSISCWWLKSTRNLFHRSSMPQAQFSGVFPRPQAAAPSPSRAAFFFFISCLAFLRWGANADLRFDKPESVNLDVPPLLKRWKYGYDVLGS